MFYKTSMAVSTEQAGTCEWVGGRTHVDAPELLHAVESDDLLQQLAPVLLAARGLGEPQGPAVLQGVLNVEVGCVVEDGDDFAVAVTVGGAIGGVGDGALWRDWDGVERDWLGGQFGCQVVGGDFGHGDRLVAVGWSECLRLAT